MCIAKNVLTIKFQNRLIVFNVEANEAKRELPCVNLLGYAFIRWRRRIKIPEQLEYYFVDLNTL